MTIDNTRLRARWGWTTVLALTVMAVLGGLDAQIKAASGYGILDLEFTSAASGVNAIMSAWDQAGMLAQMGFLMGLDYLYMPAYGFSLFYGSLAAREAFAKDGAARRILTVLAFAPLLGAGFDVIENALEAKMLFTGAADAGKRSSAAAGRIGRRTSSPPQLGQTPPKVPSAQAAQKVHSNVQMRAEALSGGRSASQHSQFGRKASISVYNPR